MSTGLTIERMTREEAGTRDLAARLGRACRGGECILLVGPLGAGKTAFVRGLAEGLGADPDRVKSPSFTLHHRHPGRLALNHLDLFFTDSPEDLERADLVDLLAGGEVAAVEWGDRFQDELPSDRLWVELAHEGPTVRRILLRPQGPGATALLARAELLPPGSPGEPDHRENR